jgi:hypothetical protein
LLCRARHDDRQRYPWVPSADSAPTLRNAGCRPAPSEAVGVSVYDEDGREVHYFTIGTGNGRKPTPTMVRAAVDRVREAQE